MEPLITSIGVIIVLIFSGQNGFIQDFHEALLFFLAASCTGSVLLAITGRFVAHKLPSGWFSLSFSGAILLFLASVMFLQPVPEKDSFLEILGPFIGLAPALLFYIALSIGTYPKIGRANGFSLWEWLGLRMFLLPIVAVLCLLFLPLALNLSFDMKYFLLKFPVLQLLGMIFVVGGLFLLAPFLLRFLFPFEELTGPLADRLNEFAGRSRIRYRKILVWKTGRRSVINACVAGMVPWSRYVFFTDTLIQYLNPDEVEAVFAHELTHVQKRHLLLLLMLFAGSMMSFIGFYEVAQIPADWERIFFGLWWGGFLFFPFARISRILELDADIGAVGIGADSCSLTSSLEKLQAISGKKGNKHSWRHFSIPYRIKSIQEYFTSEDFRLSFLKRKKRAYFGILAFIISGVVLVWSSGISKVQNNWETRLDLAALLFEKGKESQEYFKKAETETRILLQELQLSSVGFSWIELFDKQKNDNMRGEINTELHLELVRARGYRFLSVILKELGEKQDALRAFRKANEIEKKILILAPGIVTGKNGKHKVKEKPEEQKPRENH